MRAHWKAFAIALVLIAFGSSHPGLPGQALGQEMLPPGTESLGMDPGAAPMTQSGGGNFFSQDLGTMLRVGYHTEAYGQNNHGNFYIGTMQALNFDDSILFVDGQVTANDVQGVGFNLGIGRRWLTYPPYAMDMGNVQGVSIWADGTRTDEGNFYPQIGLSYESLGELWDLRANGYIPLGEQDQRGDFHEIGGVGFQGNSISELTAAVNNSSLFVGELEVARRMGSERDAWAFAGPYFLANDREDSAGYRAGVRGYAYPDLLLQFAVSNDEIFKTNATFGVTWFVGRTRTDFRPACGVPDRLREPVMRNDYVALTQSLIEGGIPLTAPDGDELRIVHIFSEAADGGDGTFERPFNELADLEPGTQNGDTILAWAGSNFDSEAGAVLLDNQRFLGEGDGFQHTIATLENGNIVIPETSPGARAGTRPLILDALGDAITLADTNEVTNFTIQNPTGNAIFAGPASNGGATLRELTISDAGDSALRFEGISANITIDDVSVTGGTGFALDFLDVATTSTVTVTDFDYNGETDATGAMRFSNFDGTFNASTSSLEGGTLQAVRITNGSGGTFTIADTVTIEDIGATVFDIDDFAGRLTANSDFDSDTGFAVSIVDMDGANAQAIFNGDITNTDDGIRVTSSNRAFIQFTGDVTLTTGANNAITLGGAGGLANNVPNTDINFNGDVVITTTTGTGFLSTEGGELTVASTNNSITTTTGTAVEITDSAASNVGVNFGEIDITAAGADNAIELRRNVGGPITLGTLGDAAGGSGSIAATTGDTIIIENTANAAISGLEINNTNAVIGVSVLKSSATEGGATQTVDLNDLRINGGASGVEVLGGAGTLNMTINDTDIIAPTNTGLRINNVDTGTIQVNDMTIDGNNATANNGVLIQNSDATITFDDGTQIREVNGVAFEVDGGTGAVTMSGDITNTVSDSVHIHDRTGGTVTMLGDVTDNGTGITIEDNTAGVINLSGTYNLDTTTDDAVEILNNDGADVTIRGFDITTTSGIGFRAEGGGDLTVLGTTNQITTDTGTGLVIDGMNIVTQATFESVTINVGGVSTVNGIVLNEVTGAAVTIGNQTGAQNSGGTIRNTTGDAIQITDVENVVLNNIRIVGAGGRGVAVTHTNGADTTAMDVTVRGLNLDSSAGDGIEVTDTGDEGLDFRLINSDLEENVDINASGSGAFRLLVDNTDINTTGTDVAFSLQYTGGPNGEADLTFRNGNAFEADNESALFIDAFTGNSKTVRLLVEDSDFANNSASATSDIFSRQNTIFNATIQGNTFQNANAAASDFDITANGDASTRMRLNLGGEVAADFNTADEYDLYELGTADFDVFEKDDTFNDLRNFGDVQPNPNLAAFDDLATPPPLPTVP